MNSDEVKKCNEIQAELEAIRVEYKGVSNIPINDRYWDLRKELQRLMDKR